MEAEERLVVVSPLGPLLLTARDGALLRLDFAGTTPGPARPRDPALTLAREELAAYFAGRLARFTVPCDLSALRPFSRRVLAALRDVPPGATVSYAELSALAGSPGAARAVGQVMARNPLPLIIPCHRVLAAGGRLGGYSGRGGTATKGWLLACEAGEAPPPPSAPEKKRQD